MYHIRTYSFLLLIALIVCCRSQKEVDPRLTYCNPINLNYRFSIDSNAVSMREAADPSALWFKGKYYLFASKSGGYWQSEDMATWQFIATTDLPTEDYAPTVIAIGDTLYFAASSGERRPFYKTAHPETGEWEVASPLFPFPVWDPAFYQDDDGRLYLYWGCSNHKPLYGVELDLNNRLMPKGEPVPLFGENRKDYGWENQGENNELESSPWLEGPCMNKYQGVYYLQYAGPGTQFTTYADGVYTATSPLGPYTYAPYSPFCRKSSGFAPGAGHSTTFSDKYGNLWHTSTLVISMKHMFERRLGLFPAGFDDKGILYCQTAFGDYPHYLPEHKVDFLQENTFTQWMLLSYKKQAQASTEIKGYPVENAFDENIKSYWAAQSGDEQWLRVDLGSQCRVNAIQVNFAEHETNVHGHQPGSAYRYLVEYSVKGHKWNNLVDKRDNINNNPHDYIPLRKPCMARYLRLKILSVPDGKIAISGFRAFGKGNAKAPEKVEKLMVKRSPKDNRRATLVWDKIENAQGYIVRYGVEKERLYSSIMVYDDNHLDLRCLNKGVDYYFTIETFNENGCTPGHLKVLARANE